MDHKIKLSAGSFESAAQAQIYCILEFMYGSVSVKIHFFWVVLHSRVIFLCFLIFNIPTGLLNLEQLLRRFLISKETLSVRMLDDSQDPTPLLKEIRDDKTATIVVDANTTMSHIILERVSVLHLAAVSFILFYLPFKNIPHFHNTHKFSMRSIWNRQRQKCSIPKLIVRVCAGASWSDFNSGREKAWFPWYMVCKIFKTCWLLYSFPKKLGVNFTVGTKK